MRLLAQSVVLVLSGSTLGLAVNGRSPHPVRLLDPVYAAAEAGAAECGGAHPGAGVRAATISRAEAQAACGACSAGFVDARGAHAFAEGHVPGALHLPPVGHSDESSAFEALRRFAEVVVYDDGADCDFAPGVAERLRAAGLKVRILEGGWSGWQAASGPAQSGACQACEGGPSSSAPGR